MRKRRGLALLGLGIGLAVVSAFMVLQIARQAAQPASAQTVPQVAPIMKVYVVMAAKDVPENVALTAQDVVTREFPAEFAPPGAISAPEYAVGKYTTSRVYKGEILVAPLLSQTRRTSQLSTSVPDGKVAMAVNVNDAMNSLGALRSGDKVDILLSLDLGPGMAAEKSSGGNQGASTSTRPAGLMSTQLTLQNAEILAIGAPGTETLDPSGKASQSPQLASKTITFLLDHQDALTLKFIKDSGGVMDLIVRSPEDKRLVKTEGVTFDTIYDKFQFRFPEAIR